MGLLARLLRRRYRIVPDLGEVVDLGEGRVEFWGEVEAVDVLHEPLHGHPCVAMEYRAWPPSTTVGLDGATAHNGRAYQLAARQSVDFVVRDRGVRVLVRARRGEDVAALHEQLLIRFGVALRAEVDTVAPGAAVRVAGRVTYRRGGAGSPLRAEPYEAIVEADRFWLDEARA